MVHSIYLPPIQEDYLGAKNYTRIIPYVVGKPISPLNAGICNTIPSDEYEYFLHIDLINKYFPGKCCLLL